MPVRVRGAPYAPRTRNQKICSGSLHSVFTSPDEVKTMTKLVCEECGDELLPAFTVAGGNPTWCPDCGETHAVRKDEDEA